MQEQLQSLEFPANGVDLLKGFGAQRPGTTPQGVNVRYFESLTQRGRGGSRPGLSRYVLPQLPTAGKVQHLNYIVDPQATALLANIDITDPNAVDDPSTNPPGSNPSDPNDPNVRNPGRIWRPGGSGVQPNRHVSNKKKKSLQFVQGKSASALGAGQAGSVDLTITFPSQVQAGQLIVIGAAYLAQIPFTAQVQISDSFGSSYSLLGQHTLFSPSILIAMNYAVAASTGTLTVHLHNFYFQNPGPTDGLQIIGGIWKNNNATPLVASAVGTDGTLFGTPTFSSGTVTANSGNAVIGFIYTNTSPLDPTPLTFDGPFVYDQVGGPGGTVNIVLASIDNASGSTDVSGSFNDGANNYVAIGASFKSESQ